MLAHTSPYNYEHSLVPLGALLHNLAASFPYPPDVPLAWLAMTCDKLALIGVLLAFALALCRVVFGGVDAPALAGLLFALMGIFLQRNDHWIHVYDFGRVYTPLLIFLAVQWWRSWVWVLPAVCMLPRIALALGTQVAGIARAIGG